MRKVVLGVGNTLLRDEGIGCHVARAVMCRVAGRLPDVEVIDCGTCADMLPIPGEVDKLVIVDAVSAGGAPGQIYRFRLNDLTLEEKQFLSLHDMSLIDSLMLMHLQCAGLAGTGEVVVVGVEPKEIDWGLELSAELRGKIPEIVNIILSELDAAAIFSSEGEESRQGEKER